MRIRFIILFLVVGVSRVLAQGTSASQSDSLPKMIGVHHFDAPTSSEPEPVQTVAPGQINWTRFGISSGILGASVITLHILQNNSWWANQRQPFHVYDDPVYQANFDKFGHIFGAYYTSHFFNEAYTWSGMDSAQADLLGALSGGMYEFYVEIEDGFAHDWGFSPGDATADLVGATFFLLRNRVDALRNFHYKWFYYPSNQLLHGHSNIPGQTFNPIDDYGGQSYWLTFDVHRALPDGAKKYWPEWLNLAAGWGAYVTSDQVTSSNLNGTSITPQMEFLIGLDFDMEKIIPESDIGILNFVRRALSYWRFPAPAYRISPDSRFFILFPFQMSIGSHAH